MRALWLCCLVKLVNLSYAVVLFVLAFHFDYHVKKTLMVNKDD